MEVLDRNVRTRHGEIDLVARDGEVVCFVEVRSRRDARYGSPDERVGPEKQDRLRRLAEAYLAKRQIDAPARFDVAAVTWKDGPQIDYIADAFE
jgi:putative endonuclease